MKRFILSLFLAILFVAPTRSSAAPVPLVKSDIQSPTITRRVSTLADLKLITGKSAISAVGLKGRIAEGDGGGGEFWWLTGDQSSNPDVLLDTLEGMFVKPTTPGDGSTGVWARQSNGRYISVEWFGTVGDGTTNDHPSIQAAVDMFQNSGGIVFFPVPEISYFIEANPIVLYDNVTVRGVYGKSKILKSQAGFYLFNVNSRSNVLIEDLLLDGGTPVADAGGVDEQKHTVVFSGAINSTVNRCIIVNSGGDGVYIGVSGSGNSDNIKVTNCVIDTVGRNGISIVGADHCTVHKTKISGARGPVGPGVGIDIEPNAGDSAIGHTITKNNISDCGRGLTVTPSSTDRISFGHLIEGNTFDQNAIGCQFSGLDSTYVNNVILRSEGTGLNISSGKRSLIANNTVYDNGTISTANGQVNITNSEDIYFTGNRVGATNTALTLSDFNVVVSGSSDRIYISNNYLFPPGSGSGVISTTQSGTVYRYQNVRNNTEEPANFSVLNMSIQDVMKTFQVNMNLYKGNGVGNFSFRRGDPSSSTELVNITNGGGLRVLGNIGVGNSAVATTLGAVVKKIEIFDFSGISLGFLPVYDAITP